jgi:hypothetical protein
MLISRIEKMRKKSYAERQRATLFVSVFLTALIAFVWGTVILPQTLATNKTETSRADTITPLKTLSEDVGIIVGDIRRGIDQLGLVISETFGGEDEPFVEVENEVGVPPLGSRGENPLAEEESAYEVFGESDIDLGETDEASLETTLLDSSAPSPAEVEPEIEE